MNEPAATYRVAQAAMGHAIVMKDGEGFETVIESGIKRYDTAVAKALLWAHREQMAAKKARRAER